MSEGFVFSGSAYGSFNNEAKEFTITVKSKGCVLALRVNLEEEETRAFLHHLPQVIVDLVLTGLASIAANDSDAAMHMLAVLTKELGEDVVEREMPGVIDAASKIDEEALRRLLESE